ncbi:MAG: response regulator transcription factor [Eubacteriaceae bacterium]|nr:response regulator transcription factor [Eubacteriaceae bacterium]
MRVLLIEDEQGIAKPLAKILEKNGLPTDSVYDGLSGYIQAQKEIYDVIILDLMLPEMDGIEVLKRIRNADIHTPVLVLTAKDTLDDKIYGLEIGADDYMSKPFYPTEVVARVRALARRKDNRIHDIDQLSFEDIALDCVNATIVVAGKPESLTAKESHILELLMKNAGNVISKDHLLDSVWGVDSEATENTVEIYIHYLRKKLENSERAKIVTSRGLGYSLRSL